MIEHIVWKDPDGVEITIAGDESDLNYDFTLLTGSRGIVAPPTSLITDKVPLVPGGIIVDVDTPLRSIDIPLLIRGRDSATLLSNVRALQNALDPDRGQGELYFYMIDGTVRFIPARLFTGLEGDFARNMQGSDWITVNLAFAAPFPYFQQLPQVTGELAGSITPILFFPFFPLRLMATDVFASDTITNVGTKRAYPLWTITGPANVIKLTNVTSGKFWQLDTVVVSGDKIYISTMLGSKYVRDSDGNSLLSTLTSYSELFSLLPGANVMQIEIGDATPATTVEYAYYNTFGTL